MESAKYFANINYIHSSAMGGYLLYTNKFTNEVKEIINNLKLRSYEILANLEYLEKNSEDNDVRDAMLENITYCKQKIYKAWTEIK